MFDKLKIDDPVGALSVHLVNGIWGTLAVRIFKPDRLSLELSSWILCVGAFVFGTSFVVWYALKLIMGLRVSDEEEFSGMDMPKLVLLLAQSSFSRQAMIMAVATVKRAQELFHLGN